MVRSAKILYCLLVILFQFTTSTVLGAECSDEDFKALISKSGKFIQIDNIYNLNGKTISLPTNSILCFRGGCVKNGTLVGDNTIVDAPMYQIFDNVTLTSNTPNNKEAWRVDVPFPEWFGATSNPNIDSRYAIQQCLDVFKMAKLNGRYYLLSADEKGNGIVLPASSTLMGDNMQFNQQPSYDILDNTIVAKSKDIKAIVNVGSRCIVKNIAIIGNNTSFSLDNKIVALYSYNSSRLTIENVDITYCYTAIDMATYMSSFNKVMCHKVVEGFYLHGLDSGPETTLSLTNCFVYDYRLVGFKVDYLYGVVFYACGCDSDNKKFTLSDGSSYLGAFYLRNLIAVSLIECGIEDVCKALTMDFCINTEVNMYRLGTYTKEYDVLYSNDINVTNCRECTLKYYGRLLNTPKNFKHINYKVSDSTNNYFYNINPSEVKCYNMRWGLSSENARQTIHYY